MLRLVKLLAALFFTWKGLFCLQLTMSKSVVYLTVLSLIFQAAVGHENDIMPTENGGEAIVKKEDKMLSVSVSIIENEKGANGIRKTEVKVNLKVEIEEDVVKVNGKFTELDAVTRYELDADVEYSGKQVRTLPVIVHVLVIKKNAENGYQFLIEEHVKFIDEKRVEQLDVQVLTIHMHKDGKEFDRTIEMVAYENSSIRQRKLKKTCGKGERRPHDHFKMPQIPDESGWSGHRHHKKHGKGFCSKFHKLPFAARVSILVGVIFVLLSSVLCCALYCCRKPKKTYTINNDDSFKAEIDMEEEAEPLPEKLAFDDDKQVLIS